MSWIAVDGRILFDDAPCIQATDEGFMFGQAVFTTCRLDNGCLLNFPAHQQRLKKHCEELEIPFRSPDLALLRDLVQRRRAQRGKWRLKILLTPNHEVAYLEPLVITPGPIRLTIFPRPIVQPHSHLKSSSYLDRLMVKRFAESQGYEDAITTSWEGFCQETAFANLFWMAEKTLFYPDESLGHLFGTTLHTLHEIVRDWEVGTRPVKLAPEALPLTARLYRCNAVVGIQPVHRVENRIFPLRPGEEARLVKALEARWRAHRVALT